VTDSGQPGGRDQSAHAGADDDDATHRENKSGRSNDVGEGDPPWRLDGGVNT
jgi:hypothetical protein